MREGCICVHLGTRGLPFQRRKKGTECQKHMDRHSGTTHSNPVMTDPPFLKRQFRCLFKFYFIVGGAMSSE